MLCMAGVFLKDAQQPETGLNLQTISRKSTTQSVFQIMLHFVDKCWPPTLFHGFFFSFNAASQHINHVGFLPKGVQEGTESTCRFAGPSKAYNTFHFP